jgi:hypothetical protein
MELQEHGIGWHLLSSGEGFIVDGIAMAGACMGVASSTYRRGIQERCQSQRKQTDPTLLTAEGNASSDLITSHKASPLKGPNTLLHYCIGHQASKT